MNDLEEWGYKLLHTRDCGWGYYCEVWKHGVEKAMIERLFNPKGALVYSVLLNKVEGETK